MTFVELKYRDNSKFKTSFKNDNFREASKIALQKLNENEDFIKIINSEATQEIPTNYPENWLEHGLLFQNFHIKQKITEIKYPAKKKITEFLFWKPSERKFLYFYCTIQFYFGCVGIFFDNSTLAFFILWWLAWLIWLVCLPFNGTVET